MVVCTVPYMIGPEDYVLQFQPLAVQSGLYLSVVLIHRACLLQPPHVQQSGREVLQQLCGHLPKKDPRQGRGQVYKKVCREVLEAHSTGEHALRRVKLGGCNA